MLRGKGPHTPKIAYDFVRVHSLMKYRDIIEYKNIGAIASLPFFHLEAQNLRHYNYWTVHELSDLE